MGLLVLILSVCCLLPITKIYVFSSQTTQITSQIQPGKVEQQEIIEGVKKFKEISIKQTNNETNNNDTVPEYIWSWVKDNFVNLIVSAAIILVSIVLVIVIRRYTKRLVDRNKLQKQYAKIINRVARWVFIFIIIISILLVFDVTIGAITGVLALFGGTILGFAAINTIGNAIAGLIIMSSKPIKPGDRIFYENQFADVIAIELIFTKLEKTDGAIIYIPNQELLQQDIINYGQKEGISRSIAITAGFDIESEFVEQALLEAVERVDRILKRPKPKVKLTEFQNFAVEYTVYYKIRKIEDMFNVESELRKQILKITANYGIDISTPNLVQSIKTG